MDVLFLPPSSTSRLRPADGKVIAALKVQSRSSQTKYALDLIDVVARDIYRAGFLWAMHALKSFWDDWESIVLGDCWNYTGIIEDPTFSSVEVDNIMTAEEAQLTSQIEKLVLPHLWIPISSLFNISDKEKCFVRVTDEETLSQVLHREDYDFHDDEISTSILPFSSMRDQLNALATFKRI